MGQDQIRTFVVGLQPGQGPAAIPINLPVHDQSVIDVEAWMGAYGSSNVYLYPGFLNLAECEADVKEKRPFINAAMALSADSVTKAPLEDGIQVLTLFFEAQNTNPQVQAVTIKTIEREAR
jgi:hypothetical protein